MTSCAFLLLEFARNQPNFNQLGKLCENFIKNSNFQSELVALVREMHDALNQTILMFGGKAFDDQGKEINGRNRSLGRSLVTNPAKLCSVIKQAFTNFLLVALKIVQFCDKFVKFRLYLQRMPHPQIAFNLWDIKWKMNILPILNPILSACL